MAASVITGCGSKAEETTKAAETEKTGAAQEQGEKAAAGEVSKNCYPSPRLYHGQILEPGAYED